MRVRDIAWAAGLFEGEGHIGFNHKSSVQLSVTMADRDVVERLRDVIGIPVRITVQDRSYQGRRRTLYQWRVSRQCEAYAVLVMFYPFFGERRRARAMEGIKRLLASPRRWWSPRAAGKKHSFIREG